MKPSTHLVRVQPGHRVEVVSPELLEGQLVHVIITPEMSSSLDSDTIVAFLDSLPDGPRAFATWDEYDRYLRQERESRDQYSCKHQAWSTLIRIS